MAAFNLTAQLNIVGPNNLKPVISNIRKQLSSVTGTVNIKIDPKVTATANGLSQGLQNLNSSLIAISSSASSAASAMGQFAAAMNSMNIKSVPKDMAAITQQSQRLQTQQTKTAAAVAQSSNSMAEFGKQSALAIRRFAAFTLVTGIIFKFTNSLGQASNEFMKFNSQLVQLSQVTGTSLQGLSGLEKTITGLSTSLGVSSSALIDVSSTLAQAGLSANEAEQALKALALSTLAPSFGDLNQTVEGSIALMRQFSISTAQLEASLGSINSVAAKFAVEADDIIVAIQRTGGVFAASSKGIVEGSEALNQFIALFTSVRATTRESAETIATGLRTIFTRIQRSETIELLKRYGIELTDLEGKFVGPYEAVKRLSMGLAGLDTRDIRFSAIIEELGGFRQVGKVIPLLQQFSTAEKALGVAQRGQTSLTGDAAKAQQALAIQMTKVQEEFIGLVRSIGSSQQFQTMVKVALDLASALISVADSAKYALPAITGLLAVKGTIGAFRFASGFASGMRRGGGAAGLGERMSGAPRGFASGGEIRRYSGGTGRRGVEVALTPGEVVLNNVDRSIGTRLNRAADSPSVLKQFSPTKKSIGGNVSVVPGSGHGDIIRARLAEGGFVVKRQSVEALGGPENIAKIISNKYGIGGTVQAPISKLKTQSKGGPFIRQYQEKHSDVMQDLDMAKSVKINRENISLTKQDFEYLKAKALRHDKNYSEKKGKKGTWSTFNKTVWAEGFEKIARRRKGAGWKRTARTGDYGGDSAPVDLINSSGEFAEVKFTHEDRPVSDTHLLNKLLRYKIMSSGDDPKRIGFTPKVGEQVPLGEITVVQPTNKDEFLQFFSPQNYKGKKKKKANLGGIIQQFEDGGYVQKLGVGGVSGKKPFGTGLYPFPKRIQNAYLKQEQKRLQDEQFNVSANMPPRGERIVLDSTRIHEEYDKPFDREQFIKTFETGVERSTLHGNIARLAKHIGLPKENLDDIVPQHIDFMGTNTAGLGAFRRRSYGGRKAEEKYDLTNYGFSKGDEQDLFGYDKLIEEKTKQARKIRKTKVKEYDDGSYSYDSNAFNAVNEELAELKNLRYKLSSKKNEAVSLLTKEKEQIADSTGKGFISLSESAFGFGSSIKNKILYHELTHQLLNSIRVKNPKAFEQYQKSVAGKLQDDSLADEFDAIPGFGYKSADVAYGRSYKLSGLVSQRLSNRSAPPLAPEDQKYMASGLAHDMTKARDYKSHDSRIESLLLTSGISKDVIDRYKEAGSEEFLTTLIEASPKLSGKLSSTLDSTLSELFGSAGIKRQRFAVGGEVQRFVNAGEVKEKPSTLLKSLGDRLERLGGIGGVKDLLGIPKGARELDSKMRGLKGVASEQMPEVSQILRKAEEAKILRVKGKISENRKKREEVDKSQQKGLLFAAVGLKGVKFSAIKKKVGKGILKKPVDVHITSGLLYEESAKKVEKTLAREYNRTNKKLAKEVLVSGVMEDFNAGKTINLDFDRTLALGADKLLSDPTKPEFSEFADESKVQEVLSRKDTKLTKLGRALRRGIQQNPQMASNLRIVTARPQHTMPLIQAWLKQQGLPITDLQGVGGAGISASQIPKRKAKVLKPGVFVDDDIANITEANQILGMKTHHYKLKKQKKDSRREGAERGFALERIIEALGGPVSLRTKKSIDFPMGLMGAAKHFGVAPNIPTDAKRTLSGPSVIESNIVNYLKAKGYASGGVIQKLSDGKRVTASGKLSRSPNKLVPPEKGVGPSPFVQSKQPTFTESQLEALQKEFGLKSFQLPAILERARMFEVKDIGGLRKIAKEEEARRIQRQSQKSNSDPKALADFLQPRPIVPNMDLARSLMPDRRSYGGLIQKFPIGGSVKAVRRKAIIDSDKFRNIKDPEEAARVAEGMKLLGATTEADYGIKLSALAGQLRESGGLKRFSVMAGAAGNRKTSLAMGRGANDDAKLRQVKRKFVLHPSDLDDADEVTSLTTTLKQSKLDYMGKADRIYSKDSSTDTEQKLVKLFTQQRNTTKDATLFNREVGTTENLSPDYGEQTASLLSQFGSAHEKGSRKGKVVVLGEKTDKSGNPLYQTRIKRGKELPELVSAQAMTSMAASPFTRGHSEAVIGTMLEEARKKNPKATHRDLLIQLAPDLSLSGGSQGMEHGARYGIFPASFRRELIKSVHPDIMVSSADNPSDTGINPRIAEIEKGISGRRRFAVAEQGAPVIISKAPHENPEGVMARYSEAGLSPKNIARTADEAGDSISGTAVRQAMISKDYDKLDRAVLPQVSAALKANQPQIRNRSLMVPLVQQSIGNFVEANKNRVNEQINRILASASGGPFTRMTPKFKDSHPDLVKQIQQLRKNRDIFEKEAYGDHAHEVIRQISHSHPDIYGLDIKRRGPTDIAVTENDIKQHIMDSSKLSTFFKSGLSFGSAKPDTPSPIEEAIKQTVSSTPAPAKVKAKTPAAAPKGSGDLPTDSKTIIRSLGGLSIPDEPKYGMFAGKSLDIDTVKKVWRKSYPQMAEEKTASYTAVKELLRQSYDAKPMKIGGRVKKFMRGGAVQKFSGGGEGEGSSVPALVSAGEGWVSPDQVSSFGGYSALHRLNHADKHDVSSSSLPVGNIGLFDGPGTGTSDSIGPVGLEAGGFVIRAAAMEALRANRGGKIQRFATGGTPKPTQNQQKARLFPDMVEKIEKGLLTKIVAIKDQTLQQQLKAKIKSVFGHHAGGAKEIFKFFSTATEQEVAESMSKITALTKEVNSAIVPQQAAKAQSTSTPKTITKPVPVVSTQKPVLPAIAKNKLAPPPPPAPALPKPTTPIASLPSSKISTVSSPTQGLLDRLTPEQRADAQAAFAEGRGYSINNRDIGKKKKPSDLTGIDPKTGLPYGVKHKAAAPVPMSPEQKAAGWKSREEAEQYSRHLNRIAVGPKPPLPPPAPRRHSIGGVIRRFNIGGESFINKGGATHVLTPKEVQEMSSKVDVLDAQISDYEKTIAGFKSHDKKGFFGGIKNPYQQDIFENQAGLYRLQKERERLMSAYGPQLPKFRATPSIRPTLSRPLPKITPIKKHMAGGKIQRFAMAGPVKPPLVSSNKAVATNKASTEKQFGKIGLRSVGKEITAFYLKNNIREGFVTANEIEPGLWNIGISKATKGYGPRLYELVAEAVTARGGKITAHRGQVKGSREKGKEDGAYGVWEKYGQRAASNRTQEHIDKYGPSVVKTPLDQKHHTIDKDPNSPLNYGYQIQPNLIKGPDIVDMNDPKYKQFVDSLKFGFLSRSVGGEIPIMAQEGEFVLNKHATGQIGEHTLAKLNRGGKLAVQTLEKLPKYHSGGLVQKLAKGGATITPLKDDPSMSNVRTAKGVDLGNYNNASAGFKNVRPFIDSFAQVIDRATKSFGTLQPDVVQKAFVRYAQELNKGVSSSEALRNAENNLASNLQGLVKTRKNIPQEAQLRNSTSTPQKTYVSSAGGISLGSLSHSDPKKLNDYISRLKPHLDKFSFMIDKTTAEFGTLDSRAVNSAYKKYISAILSGSSELEALAQATDTVKQSSTTQQMRRDDIKSNRQRSQSVIGSIMDPIGGLQRYGRSRVALGQEKLDSLTFSQQSNKVVSGGKGNFGSAMSTQVLENFTKGIGNAALSVAHFATSLGKGVSLGQLMKSGFGNIVGSTGGLIGKLIGLQRTIVATDGKLKGMTKGQAKQALKEGKITKQEYKESFGMGSKSKAVYHSSKDQPPEYNAKFEQSVKTQRAKAKKEELIAAGFGRKTETYVGKDGKVHTKRDASGKAVTTSVGAKTQAIMEGREMTGVNPASYGPKGADQILATRRSAADARQKMQTIVHGPGSGLPRGPVGGGPSGPGSGGPPKGPGGGGGGPPKGPRGTTQVAAPQAQPQQGGGMGGMGMYMGEMALSMAGSAVADQYSKSLGGEKTLEGRMAANRAGSAVTGASTGMMVGTMIGGAIGTAIPIPVLGTMSGAAVGGAIGTGVGAAAGLGYSMLNDKEIKAQYASEQRQGEIKRQSEKLGMNVGAMNNRNLSVETRERARTEARGSFNTILSKSAEEQREARQNVGYFSYKPRLTAQERAESAQEAKDQSKNYVEAEMQRTGKTLQQVSASMDPGEWAAFQNTLADSDLEFQKLKDDSNATAEQLAKGRAAAIERGMTELKYTDELNQAAKENARLAKATQKITTSFEKLANAVDAAAARASRVMENSKIGIEAVDNPLAAVQQGQISKSADILSNPSAYSIQEVEDAARQNATMAGTSTESMVQAAVLPRKLEESFGSAMVEARSSGKNDDETRSSVKAAVTNTVKAAFGEDLGADMQKKIDDFLNSKAASGELQNIDFNDLMKEIPGLADKMAASGKVMEALKSQAQAATNAIAMMGDAAAKGAAKDQESRNLKSDTFSTIANSTLAFKRGTGEKISWQADAGVRNQARAIRLGTTSAVAASPGAMLNRYNLLQGATQQAATNQQQVNEANRAGMLGGDKNATTAMQEAANATAQFAQSTKQARDEIMALPGDIKENINGIMQELQDAMQERNAKIGAASGFMEKMLTSTPQGMKKMGNTFNNLNQTLAGRGVSFEESYSANTAYNQVRKQGGNHNQAQRAAQEAYAQESSDTLSMAKELAPLLGAVDPNAQNQMMASVYENMFKARGQDPSQMMVGGKSMQEYLDMMKKGPGEDPKVKALQDALAGQQAALKEAAATANTVLMNEKEEIIVKTGKAVEDAMKAGAEAVRIAMEEAMKTGVTAPGEVGNQSRKNQVETNNKAIEEAKKTIESTTATEEEKKKARATKMEKEQENAVLTGSKSAEEVAAKHTQETKEQFNERKQKLIDKEKQIADEKAKIPPTAQNAQANAQAAQAAAPAPVTNNSSPAPTTTTGTQAASTPVPQTDANAPKYGGTQQTTGSVPPGGVTAGDAKTAGAATTASTPVPQVNTTNTPPKTEPMTHEQLSDARFERMNEDMRADSLSAEQKALGDLENNIDSTTGAQYAHTEEDQAARQEGIRDQKYRISLLKTGDKDKAARAMFDLGEDDQLNEAQQAMADTSYKDATAAFAERHSISIKGEDAVKNEYGPATTYASGDDVLSGMTETQKQDAIKKSTELRDSGKDQYGKQFGEGPRSGPIGTVKPLTAEEYRKREDLHKHERFKRDLLSGMSKEEAMTKNFGSYSSKDPNDFTMKMSKKQRASAEEAYGKVTGELAQTYGVATVDKPAETKPVVDVSSPNVVSTGIPGLVSKPDDFTTGNAPTPSQQAQAIAATVGPRQSYGILQTEQAASNAEAELAMAAVGINGPPKPAAPAAAAEQAATPKPAISPESKKLLSKKNAKGAAVASYKKAAEENPDADSGKKDENGKSLTNKEAYERSQKEYDALQQEYNATPEGKAATEARSLKKENDRRLELTGRSDLSDDEKTELQTLKDKDFARNPEKKAKFEAKKKEQERRSLGESMGSYKEAAEADAEGDSGQKDESGKSLTNKELYEQKKDRYEQLKAEHKAERQTAKNGAATATQGAATAAANQASGATASGTPAQRPGPMGLANVHQEAQTRGMTAEEVNYERQQQYLSQFNPETRAAKEKSMGRGLLKPSERQLQEAQNQRAAGQAPQQSGAVPPAGQTPATTAPTQSTTGQTVPQTAPASSTGSAAYTPPSSTGAPVSAPRPLDQGGGQQNQGGGVLNTSGLEAFAGKLDTLLTKLGEVNIPTEIRLTSENLGVNVTLNGGEVMKNLPDQLKQSILREVAESIRNYDKGTSGEGTAGKPGVIPGK